MLPATQAAGAYQSGEPARQARSDCGLPILLNTADYGASCGVQRRHDPRKARVNHERGRYRMLIMLAACKGFKCRVLNGSATPKDARQGDTSKRGHQDSK